MSRGGSRPLVVESVSLQAGFLIRCSPTSTLSLRRERDAPEVLQMARVGLNKLNSVGTKFLDRADLRDHASVRLRPVHVPHHNGGPN